MIKITRVDERLVHGQVAFAWTNSLGADCILVVNDEAAADKIRATTLKLAAPAGIKFFHKVRGGCHCPFKRDKDGQVQGVCYSGQYG